MAIQVPTVYLPPFFGVTFGGGTNQGVIEAKHLEQDVTFGGRGVYRDFLALFAFVAKSHPGQ